MLESLAGLYFWYVVKMNLADIIGPDQIIDDVASFSELTPYRDHDGQYHNPWCLQLTNFSVLFILVH